MEQASPNQDPQEMQAREEESQGKVAAFFDMDRTLITVNSATLYIKHEFRSGRISIFTMMQAFWYLLLYYFSLIDMDRALRKAMQGYEGSEDQALRDATYDWFTREVIEHLQPGAEVALQGHREVGHPCVLLTSSSCYAAEVAKEVWSLDDWLANRFVLDESGRLSGEFEMPLCHGAGKVIWAERWAERHDVDLSRSYFYTDSLTDLPMLERVGYPRVVNPDPRLRRVALRRGWLILDWKRAEEGARGLPAGKGVGDVQEEGV